MERNGKANDTEKLMALEERIIHIRIPQTTRNVSIR